ncbi:MAG: DUF2239 family protein [Hydrogenophaga sp.]
MKTESSPPTLPTCTAFLGDLRIAFGDYGAVAEALASMAQGQGGGLLVFDDATAQLVDFPWPKGYVYPQPESPADEAPEEDPSVAPPSVGRPRLGVVAREVTLLPRHWAWLATQRGGASAALRRLVESARKQHSEYDAQRQAQERAYRFMAAIAGGLPGFEEASRALFAQDGGAFAERVRAWPEDIRNHLSWLARGAFVAL